MWYSYIGFIFLLALKVYYVNVLLTDGSFLMYCRFDKNKKLILLFLYQGKYERKFFSKAL